MIVINAILQAKSGKEPELENMLKAMVPHVQAEQGALAYVLHRAPKNPGKFLFYEKYRDQAAVDYHMSTPYLQQLFKKFDDLLAEAPIVEIFEEIAAISR
ncbi:MAG: putative quinol monooxygenase [Proteobacteria bacterium]|nr:putative quinol monooxygenase [Pseudomonadota bacterium]